MANTGKSLEELEADYQRRALAAGLDPMQRDGGASTRKGGVALPKAVGGMPQGITPQGLEELNTALGQGATAESLMLGLDEQNERAGNLRDQSNAADSGNPWMGIGDVLSNFAGKRGQDKLRPQRQKQRGLVAAAAAARAKEAQRQTSFGEDVQSYGLGQRDTAQRETGRANTARERLSRESQRETGRHNLVTEKETYDTNRFGEYVSMAEQTRKDILARLTQQELLFEKEKFKAKHGLNQRQFLEAQDQFAKELELKYAGHDLNKDKFGLDKDIRTRAEERATQTQAFKEMNEQDKRDFIASEATKDRSWKTELESAKATSKALLDQYKDEQLDAGQLQTGLTAARKPVKAIMARGEILTELQGLLSPFARGGTLEGFDIPRVGVGNDNLDDALIKLYDSGQFGGIIGNLHSSAGAELRAAAAANNGRVGDIYSQYIHSAMETLKNDRVIEVTGLQGSEKIMDSIASSIAQTATSNTAPTLRAFGLLYQRHNTTIDELEGTTHQQVLDYMQREDSPLKWKRLDIPDMDHYGAGASGRPAGDIAQITEEGLAKYPTTTDFIPVEGVPGRAYNQAQELAKPVASALDNARQALSAKAGEQITEIYPELRESAVETVEGLGSFMDYSMGEAGDALKSGGRVLKETLANAKDSLGPTLDATKAVGPILKQALGGSAQQARARAAAEQARERQQDSAEAINAEENIEVRGDVLNKALTKAFDEAKTLAGSAGTLGGRALKKTLAPKPQAGAPPPSDDRWGDQDLTKEAIASRESAFRQIQREASSPAEQEKLMKLYWERVDKTGEYSIEKQNEAMWNATRSRR